MDNTETQSPELVQLSFVLKYSGFQAFTRISVIERNLHLKEKHSFLIVIKITFQNIYPYEYSIKINHHKIFSIPFNLQTHSLESFIGMVAK